MDKKDLKEKVESTLESIEVLLNKDDDNYFEDYLTIFNQLVFIKECLINYSELKEELKNREFDFAQIGVQKLTSPDDTGLVEDLRIIKSKIS